MKKNSKLNTLNIVTCAMLSAMAVISGSIVHMLSGGDTVVAALLSPMHFPVLLAGILCGPWLGLICGAATPWISFLANGRPPFPNSLIPMFLELAAYGFMAGMMRSVFIKNPKINKFASVLALVIAMVAGRLVSAFVGPLFVSSDESYFVAMLTKLGSNFVKTWSAILIQLVLIPAILFALQKSGVLLKYLPDTPTNKSASSDAVDNSAEAASPEEKSAENQ